LASDDHGDDAKPDNYPQWEEECEQQDADDVFDCGRHVHVVLLGVMRRKGLRDVPKASSSGNHHGDLSRTSLFVCGQRPVCPDLHSAARAPPRTLLLPPV
jgi:hypothetical protein